MPRAKSYIPAYRRHRPTGQAVVTLSGQDWYLGPYGTDVSRAAYDRVVAEWIARGRRAQLDPLVAGELLVAELIIRYVTHAEGYYRKNGQPTNEIRDIKLSLRPLREMYGERSVSEFGPNALKAVRERMIQQGLSRGVVNQRIQRIRRAFKWGASCELLDVRIH